MDPFLDEMEQDFKKEEPKILSFKIAEELHSTCHEN